MIEFILKLLGEVVLLFHSPVLCCSSVKGGHETKVRRILLKDVAGIFAGQQPEGLTTPLDDLCATMVVRPHCEMISFRLEHINARDTFVMCMMLFAQSQGAEMIGVPSEGQPDEEEEEAEEDGIDLVLEEAKLSSAAS